jgi:hypothetical protein
MSSLYGKCFIKTFQPKEYDELISNPVPPKKVITTFTPKPGVPCVTIPIRFVSVGSGGDGASNTNYCSGGGGGGGGGTVHETNNYSLKAITCYSRYAVYSSGSSIYCYSCGPNGFKIQYQYGASLPGIGEGYNGGTAGCYYRYKEVINGAPSYYAGGNGYYSGTGVYCSRFGSGGGGGGSGGPGQSVGSCAYQGGNGGIGTSIVMPDGSSQYLGGGGGGGSAFLNGYITRAVGLNPGRGNSGINPAFYGGCGGYVYASAVNGRQYTGQGGGGGGPVWYQNVVYIPAPPPPFWGSIVGGAIGFFTGGVGGAIAGALLGSLVGGGGSGSVRIDHLSTQVLYYGGKGGSGISLVEYTSPTQRFSGGTITTRLDASGNKIYTHTFYTSDYLTVI